ncbi:MAG: hypothetical protein IPM64_17215 [Phycisphaerales bacterium]|nr:hypothetical protein [Phycisphaerales bacterium]
MTIRHTFERGFIGRAIYFGPSGWRVMGNVGEQWVVRDESGSVELLPPPPSPMYSEYAYLRGIAAAGNTHTPGGLEGFRAMRDTTGWSIEPPYFAGGIAGQAKRPARALGLSASGGLYLDDPFDSFEAIGASLLGTQYGLTRVGSARVMAIMQPRGMRLIGAVEPALNDWLPFGYDDNTGEFVAAPESELDLLHRVPIAGGAARPLWYGTAAGVGSANVRAYGAAAIGAARSIGVVERGGTIQYVPDAERVVGVTEGGELILVRLKNRGPWAVIGL